MPNFLAQAKRRAEKKAAIEYPIAREEFERQHSGRNLKRHPLHGTYYNPNVAALWNQHIRTIIWLKGHAE